VKLPQSRGSRLAAPEMPAAAAQGARFAFYGRTSTEGFQDSETSRAWQREVAESVIAGHGEIAVEFVDVGWSCEVAWERRPRASALLTAARSPGRRFDAVVVGEYERGFTARQFLRVAERLARDGVCVWLPEADGPVTMTGITAHPAGPTLTITPSPAVRSSLFGIEFSGESRSGFTAPFNWAA